MMQFLLGILVGVGMVIVGCFTAVDVFGEDAVDRAFEKTVIRRCAEQSIEETPSEVWTEAVSSARRRKGL